MSVLPRLAEEQGHFFLTAISRIELAPVNSQIKAEEAILF